MFFKKDREEFLHRLEEKLQTAIQGFSMENKQLKDQLEEMGQNIGQLQSAVRKQEMALGDFLDEWSDRQEEEDDVKKRLREREAEERKLLELFEAYQEQFWSLKRFADKKDEEWSGQIALMEKNLAHFQKLCGISIIGEWGVEVDYDLHEVIEVIKTSEADKDKRIADIFRCGYLYKGKVKKKAQVIAYHLDKQGEGRK